MRLTHRAWIVLFLCCSFLLAGLYLRQYLQHPALNLIDDGWALHTAAQLHAHPSLDVWYHHLVETKFGRLRPLYWLYFYAVWPLFGTTPIWYWLGQVSILAFTLFAMAIVLRHSKSPVLLWFVIAGLLLFFPATSDNFFRLGPAEPRQVLLCLVFTLWLFHWNKGYENMRSMVLGGALLLGAYLAKETSISLFPGVVVYLVSTIVARKHSIKFSAIALSLYTVITILFLAAIPPRVSYTSGYRVSPEKIVQTIKEMRLEQIELFYPLFCVSALYAISVVMMFRERFDWKQIIYDQRQALFLFISAMSSLALFLPWEYAKLERYFYPFLVYVLLFSSVACTTIVRVFVPVVRRQVMLGRVVIGALLILPLFLGWKVAFSGKHLQPTLVWERTRQSKQALFIEYQMNDPFIQYLLADDLPHSIFVGDADYERIQEIGIFASQLGGRTVRTFSANAAVAQDFGSSYQTVGETTGDVYQQFQLCKSECVFVFRPQYFADYSRYPELADAVSKGDVAQFGETLRGRLWFAYHKK